ncbi:MAG: hypothetical protein ACOCV2_01065 [Persicimonas sp.]
MSIWRITAARVSSMNGVKRPTFWAVLLASLLVFAGCGNDPEPEDDGGTSDVADAADTSDVADVGDGGDADADAGEDGFCAPCSDDSECGGEDDLCTEMPAGDSGCTESCDPDDEDACSDGTFCAQVDEETEAYQCVPENLTCEERCEDADCGDDQVCDPWSGECIDPLGTCDTGCTVSEICGDGPEDQCVSLTEGERSCLPGCDPEAEEPDCPVDYFCTPLTDDPEVEEGVCAPIRGTCEDRCADVECDDGENCDELTGECVEAEYSYCESGCESNAECGGANDRCFDLGISDGAHCWQDCSDDEDVCGDNYQCTRLGGTTMSLCLPENDSCDECEDASCYPDGYCDPVEGECRDLETDCSVTGCDEGELCDPVSTDCVEVGRSCEGNSWAADCDNTVSACTTRRADTEGSCEAICDDDDDCGVLESCVETNLRSFCLPDDLNGPLTCGTLHESGSDVGTPCGDDEGSCPSGASTCVDEAGIDGFCTRSCSDDGDCDEGQTCQGGPDGESVCIPAQCQCASLPSMNTQLLSAWETALSDLELSQCDLWLDPEVADELDGLGDTPLANAALAGLVEYPMGAAGGLENTAGNLDDASGPTAAIEQSAAPIGLSVSGAAGSYSYSGSDSKLTQAASDFIEEAGGTPDTGDLEDEAADVPEDFQDVAAPIISAAADALEARHDALDNAGWGDTIRSEAFEGAPYLFLPGTTSQVDGRPDFENEDLVEEYEAYPTEEMAQAAADLSATIEDAVESTSGSDTWTGFEYIVDTPAGKIVLGDADDTDYDPSANSDLDGSIAVLVDPGGDDTYRIPVGANQSVDNGVSIAVDMGGEDVYTYEEVSDPNDSSELLPSDEDGRDSGGDLVDENGPVSLSTTARQGTGRVGIGLLFDLGDANDTYESLRMSQGAALLGVGLLYDEGGDDSYEAEAFAQGAAMLGVGAIWDEAGSDDYRLWHAGQGFGTASGAGILSDADGNDDYEAVPGESDGSGVLYLSRSDRGASNRNLAQGAGAGIESDDDEVGLAGGVGLLRDRVGADAYTAGTHAQGFGSVRGIGAIVDSDGNDVYEGRAQVQGTGQRAAGGLLFDEGGSDDYNQSGDGIQEGHGLGQEYGWGVLYDTGGDDQIEYLAPGGGVGLDGSFGMALFGDGVDEHNTSTQASFGFTRNEANDAPLDDSLTLGIFLDVGGETDTYDHPDAGAVGVGNDATWRQPDDSTPGVERGIGIDE